MFLDCWKELEYLEQTHPHREKDSTVGLTGIRTEVLTQILTQPLPPTTVWPYLAVNVVNLGFQSLFPALYCVAAGLSETIL